MQMNDLAQKTSKTLRVLVISDTHGSDAAIRRALEVCRQIDVAIHLGDIVSDAKLLRDLMGERPCYFVRGNCDSYNAAEDELLVTIGGVTMLLVHGHEDGVKYDMMRLYYHALEHEATVALYGHTHVSDIDRAGNVWMINPGSASRPRMGRPRTCALLEVRDGKVYPGIVSL